MRVLESVLVIVTEICIFFHRIENMFTEATECCSIFLLFCLHALAQESVTRLTTVSYRGSAIKIVCPIPNLAQTPYWFGPPNKTIYYDNGPGTFNPNLGEKLERLSISTDLKSLHLTGTILSDAGLYSCNILINNITSDGFNSLVVRVSPNDPVITTNESVDSNGIRSKEGQNVTVICTSRGGYPTPTVSWYKESINTNPLKETSTGTLDGDTYTVTLVYTFTTTRQDDRQLLVCSSYWPTPANRQNTLISNVTLYLYLKPAKPTLVQRNVVQEGDDVTVECRTSQSRPAATISWVNQDQTSTISVTVINDTTTQTFTTVSVLQRRVIAADNGQTVMCRVLHMTLNNALTAFVALNVSFPVGPSSTRISGNRVIIADGSNSLTLNCSTGSSNPPANITWRNGSNVIFNNNTYTNSTGANNGVVRSQSLLINPTRYNHRNIIRCSATNGVNQFTDTTTATLILHFSPIVTISVSSSLTLTEQSAQVKVQLPCNSDSNPMAMITWYHNGDPDTSGSISNSLPYTIEEVNRTTYGNYTCTANNNVQPSDSKTYTVKVFFRPLEVSIDKPTGEVIANGQNPMSITCKSGTSNPVSEIKWDTGVISTDTESYVDSHGTYGGTVRTSTIRFNATRYHDGAAIMCTARNNISGQHEVFSSTVIDNIIYHPLIADIPARNVTEGNTVTLPCYASSKPPANFTWTNGSNVVVNNGRGTVLDNGLNYTIQNASRTHAGTYTCTAVNQVQPGDFEQTLLTVLYPPDITVTAINTTVDNGSTTVICEASGVPDKYTYESWVHMWNGNVVKHKEPLPALRVLKLTDLSYAHSGVYKCRASNGVKGLSSGSGNLLVKSPPIIVGNIAKTLEIKASGQLMKAITVTLQYYSNAGRGSVTVQKTNGTRADVADVQLKDVEISLPVFLSEINTTGTEATINITVTNMSQFGGYDVFVANEIRENVKLSLIIQPLGPPEPPELINSTILDHQSVTLIWISGFPNGLNQTFVIQLSTDNSTWWNITQYGGMAYQQTHNRTIENLASSQLYFVRMLATNAEGESEHSSTLSFLTAASPDPSVSTPVALIAIGAAGGVVAAAIVIVVIIVIVRRRKAAACTPGSAKDKGALVMTSNHNEGYDNGDEEVINRLYESAGVTETVAGASPSKQVPPLDVENIYAKVNKKPEVLYAMPDKRIEKKLKKQQNQTEKKSKKDGKRKKGINDKSKNTTGDVYENAPSIMSCNKSTPQSGESVYEDTSISVHAALKIPTGTDGLLYADLEFAPKKKGPSKIIGIEDRCEYTTIDLTKKAQPLPDSDDEDNTRT